MMLIKKTKSRAQGHFGFLTAVWSPNNDLWENGLIQFFEERPDIYTPLQETNKGTLTTSKHAYEFINNYFPCHLVTE